MTLDSTEPRFGVLEDEAVNRGKVTLTGRAKTQRPLHEGERVILIIEGVAGLPSFERDSDTNELVRVDKLKVRAVLEPETELPVATFRRITGIIERRRRLEGELEGQTAIEDEGGGG